ncbi:nuclear transport factor 2 family protein [Nocardia sp. NPDC051981]|uniref:nuclear transport factor 2 family protein n=1 Tax=Nocardia sp. NPDC051981 TaxID=3155417 RepID=UPI0034416C1C
MSTNQPQTIAPQALPEVINRYLTAHRAHDKTTACSAFTPDATVVDDGNSYDGCAAIEEWLNRSATEFTYTIELTAAQRLDATHYIATQHLEGDFPGGTVDLRYQFTVRGDMIEHLVIAP